MITALASDYWSVYYLDLDTDDGVCYQAHDDVENGFRVGDRFKYLASVTAYAREYVKAEYLEEFLAFVQPENVKARLLEQRIATWCIGTAGTRGKRRASPASGIRRTGRITSCMPSVRVLWTWTGRPGRAWSSSRPCRRH